MRGAAGRLAASTWHFTQSFAAPPGPLSPGPLSPGSRIRPAGVQISRSGDAAGGTGSIRPSIRETRRAGTSRIARMLRPGGAIRHATKGPARAPAARVRRAPQAPARAFSMSRLIFSARGESSDSSARAR
ncbi:MAG: hypothetical protein KatS3mg118_3702 [Paracoccaceae bacterium]|nr:MAG: hypothetical protein KatS3mg118_3702 [Paracoccaceae bacterium]